MGIARYQIEGELGLGGMAVTTLGWLSFALAQASSRRRAIARVVLHVDRGRVVRLDPAKGKATAEYKVGSKMPR